MISVTAKNVELKPDMKEYIDQKFSELDKYLDRIQFIDVVVEEEKLLKHVSLKIGVKKMGAVTLKEKAESFNEAVDLVRDKAKKRLTRMKEKVFSQ